MVTKINKYTGKLSDGQLYQSKTDGNIVRVDSISKPDKVFMVNLFYVQSTTKKGLKLNVPAYDFEKDILWGKWKLINPS
jgi:hypothetical protein